MTTTKKKTTTRKPRVVKAAAPIPNLPRKPFVFEVLDLVSKQKAKAKKIEVLRKYDEFGQGATFPQVVVDGNKLGGCTDTVKYLQEKNLV